MTIEHVLELGVLSITLSSIWLLLVLSIRIFVTRWLGARWAYYLWLVPLLGLLAMAVPSQQIQHVIDIPGIEIPVVNNVIEAASGMIVFAEDVSKVIPAQTGSPGSFTAPELLLTAWLLGTLFSLWYFSTQSFQFSKRMYRSSRPLTDSQASLVRSRCTGLANMSRLRLRILPGSRGPAVAGVIQPVLLLPVDFFSRYSSQQQVLILEHEYEHLRRHDLMYLLIARCYRCLFWFNPLVYLAEWYLQLDQELSCDEKVLATRNLSTRRVYGETLILSAHTATPITHVSYSPSFGQIKQRTFMLRHHRQRILTSVLGGLLLMVSVSVSFTYGMLGVPEFKPDLTIRESLQVPMTQALMELKTGVLDQQRTEALLTRLKQLETTFPEQPLSDIELAHLTDVMAQAYYQSGDYDRALILYGSVVSLTHEVPEHQARALNIIAEIQFAKGNYVETIRALAQSRDIDPAISPAQNWALRSRAFVKLQYWDKGLRYINFAIKQTEKDGNLPPKNWLLTQTALQWKVGDLKGAAQSLKKSVESSPEDSYEYTLVAFNDRVQEVWEPGLAKVALARF